MLEIIFRFLIRWRLFIHIVLHHLHLQLHIPYLLRNIPILTHALKVDATASLYCGKIFCVKEENIRISASMEGDDYNGVNMDVERITELLAEDDRWISDMDFCRKTGFSYSTLNGWKNGRRNPSSELIGVLCNPDAIKNFDWYVFSKVCRFLERLNNKGLRLLPISVNLSRKHLVSDPSELYITTTANLWKIPHKYLGVEITESAAEDNPIELQRLIYKIRMQGFKVAIDDFGTGNANFKFLIDNQAA